MRIQAVLVDSSRGSILPARDSLASAHFLTRAHPRHQVGVGTAVLVAGALAIVVALAVPRPDIVLTNPQFFPGTCNTTTNTRDVTATFTLTNRGGIDGAVEVNLLADGNSLTTYLIFEVPAHVSMPATIYATVSGCGYHRYSLTSTYPATPG